MSESSTNKRTSHISSITEKFCSRLGRNTVIVTTRTADGETKKCLYAEECKQKKECCDKMT